MQLSVISFSFGFIFLSLILNSNLEFSKELIILNSLLIFSLSISNSAIIKLLHLIFISFKIQEISLAWLNSFFFVP